MPAMSGRVSMLTGASSGNVVLGQQYELMPFDGTVEFLAIADGNLVTVAIFSGSDILCQPGAAVPIAAAEATPTYPDHLLAEDEAAEGDRLSLVFQNGNAATRIVNWRILMSPA